MTGLLSAGKADAMLMEATMTASKITKAPFILRPLVGMTRNTQKNVLNQIALYQLNLINESIRIK